MLFRSNAEIQARQDEIARIKKAQQDKANAPKPFSKEWIANQNKPQSQPSFVINVHSADPKAVVDAVKKYAKQNGGLGSLLKGNN